MFFAKLITSSIVLFGLSSAVIASPIAQPETHLEEKRQLPDLLGPLSGLQSNIAPILSSMTSVASKGGDLTGLIGQLGGNFGSTTKVLSGLTGQQTSGDPTQLATSIISSVLSTVGHLPTLSKAQSSPLDSSMSNFLGVLNTLSPGVTSSVSSAVPSSLGSGLPLSGVLNLLNLSNLSSLLSLTSLLTGLLGSLLGGGLLGGLLGGL
ncbi:hypothetical protein NLI96_g7192 [Meripilus lineatus]|uniref:Uncharacterized protein n=1 Tax=Meripilus lineatus TaxID=2056292 RepID=A0AAD5YHH4_9APHY|nr:hypothetical protein NLI96_g7192 [Physisporinus lineatus]